MEVLLYFIFGILFIDILLPLLEGFSSCVVLFLDEWKNKLIDNQQQENLPIGFAIEEEKETQEVI